MFRNTDIGRRLISFSVDQEALRTNTVRPICPLVAKALIAFSSPTYIGKILLLKPDAPKAGLCRTVRVWLMRLIEPYVAAISIHNK